MTDFEIEDQNVGISEADMAALRWKAIEASNCAPGISPVARRVLSALICAMNGRTRECFPSELWLAESLGIHLFSVKKAKAELRKKHGLITWTNPGGQRHLSYYQFNWQMLLRLSEEAKHQAREAVVERRKIVRASGSRVTTTEAPPHGSRMTTTEPSNGSEAATMERIEAASESSSVVAKPLLCGSQIASHGSHTATPVVAASLPNPPINNLTRTANLYHDVGTSPRDAVTSPRPPLPRPSQPAAPKRALEARPVQPVETFPYPKLLEAFEDMPNICITLRRMDAAMLTEVSKLYATKGKQVAAVYVVKAAA